MKLSKPEGLILDFDGVFTDNSVYTDSSGKEIVKTSKYDSLALKNFHTNFPLFPIIVISSETNETVAKRCSKLKLKFYNSVEDKIAVANDWSKRENLDLKNCIFLCNDINDIELCKLVGYPVGVLDCNPKIMPYLKHTTKVSGGNGAIAEILEMTTELINSNNYNKHKSFAPESPLNESVGAREWGTEKLLFLSSGNYTVKELFIKKGFKGGLQMHRLKDESSYVVSGKLLVRFDDGNGILQEKIFSPGSSLRFRPGCVHQEEALEDTVLIECSTPHFNDRVRMEDFYKMPINGSKGLPSTSIFDIETK